MRPNTTAPSNTTAPIPTQSPLPLQALAAAGVDTLLLTNPAGSLREDMPPGALMMINDHIAFSGRNPLIGEQDDDRFVNMVDAYDPALQAQMRAAAQRLGVALDEGAYMWFSGPSFETPAEIRMARAFGADAVGMSTVPETILARWMGLRVAAVSMITNLGAGMTGRPLSHAETKEEAGKAAANMTRLIAGFAEDFA